MVTKLQQYITERTVLKTNTGCWEWQRCILSTGYGQAMYKGTQWRAHRLSYTAFKGNIPEGMMVLHNCDNPSCCNPQHLRIGTHKDNMGDRLQRERTTKGMSYNRGEGHGKAKLSEIDVLTIRDLLSNSGYTQKQIGEMFGVNSRTVSGIKQGTVWGHL